MEAQRELGDEAERAERAAVEAGEVETGDVLDHPAAGMGDDAVAGDDGRSDHEVPHRPVRKPPRAGVVGGEDASDRRSGVGERRVDGEPLPVRGQFGLQRREARAGPDDGDPVERVVQHDAGQ